VGHIEVAHIDYYLPDGRLLLSDVSFRVGEAVAAALVGPNGSGKTTLIRLIGGDIRPDSGTITSSGGLGVMPQFIGSIRDDRTVRDLLLITAPKALRVAGQALRRAKTELDEHDNEKSQLAYAQALADWGDAGGYLQEATWDACTMAALGQSYDFGQ
jgi:ATPase subunit of ABC transporter with duplicated ATPase domains